MSTKHLLFSVVALLSVVPLAMAQGQVSPPNQSSDLVQTQYQGQDRMTTGAAADRSANPGERQACKASEIIGLTVRTAKDEEKGKIKDLMIGMTAAWFMRRSRLAASWVSVISCSRFHSMQFTSSRTAIRPSSHEST